MFYKLGLCRDTVHTTQTECSRSLDFVGTVIHSTHNANTVFYKLWKLRLCRDSNTQYTQYTTQTECSISLDFVGTVIHSTHNANRVFYKFVETVIHSTHNANTVFYKLWKLRLCRDSNTQYTQRKQSVL